MSRKRKQKREERKAVSKRALVSISEGSEAVDFTDPLSREANSQAIRTITPQVPREADEAAGTDGVVLYDGSLRSDEIEAKLRGRERWVTYTNILINTAIVAAGYRFYSNLMRRAKWTLEPANDSAEAKTRMEFVQSVMDGMDDQSWSSVVAQIATHKYYGFSIQEMVTKKRKDGRTGFAGIYSRPQYTIEKWNKKGDKIVGVAQRSPQTQAWLYMRRNRIIHCVDNAVSSGPEGLGLARHLVEVTDKLQGYETLEARGFETDLRGTPIGYAPMGDLVKNCSSQAKKDEAKTKGTAALQSFIQNYRKGNDASLVLDSAVQRGSGDQNMPINVGKWRLELLRGDPTTLQELAAAIERKNREAARILGVEMLLLGATSAGSLALSQDKNLAFGLNVDSGLGEVGDSLEKDFLGYLWDVNGWDREDGLRPKMKPERQQFRNIKEVAEALESIALSGAPILPNDPVVNELREMLGFSHMPADLMVDALNARMATLSEDRIDPDAAKQSVPGAGNEGEGT